jgi:DNA-binding XRE family transcriptional regulator
MNSTHGYDREGFLAEFFPDGADRAEVEVGAQALVNVNRAHRLAEMRKRLGLTQAEVAARMNVRQERVSAIERAKVDTSELRTLAAYVRALGGRMEIVADFGGERLVIG